MTMTTNIRDALIQVDGAHADTYKQNTNAYLAKLSQLDKYIMDEIATIPQDQRKMVTNHDAFGYYIDRYGLIFVGSDHPVDVHGRSAICARRSRPDTENQSAEREGYLPGKLINPKLAQQIGHDANVKVVDTLYGDTLGAAGTPGASMRA